MNTPVLLPAELSRLIRVALDAGLHDDPAYRKLLFSRMPRIRAKLSVSDKPEIQLRTDLVALNETSALRDGRLPLLLWLESALELVAGMQAEEEIEQFIARVAPGAPAPVDLPALAALPVFNEDVVYQNDMLPISYMRQGLRAADSVARLLVRRYQSGVASSGNSGLYWGTGWLIGKDLLLTNHHVINARDKGEPPASDEDFGSQGANVQVEFGADGDNRAGEKWTCGGVIASNCTLDYALLKLVPASDRAALPVAAQPLRLKAGDYIPLNIIQHPQGNPKHVAIRNNLAWKVEGQHVYYFTDTLPGSSGSPVFDDEWNVVALHRASTVTKGVQFQGRTTAIVNLGTVVHQIISDMRKQNVEIKP